IADAPRRSGGRSRPFAAHPPVHEFAWWAREVRSTTWHHRPRSTRRSPMRWWLAMTCVLLAGSFATARAQVLEVPTFEVARPTLEQYVSDADVAVGADGTVLVLYSEWNPHSLNAGNALTVPVSADGTVL